MNGETQTKLYFCHAFFGEKFLVVSCGSLEEIGEVSEARRLIGVTILMVMMSWQA